MTPHEFIDTRRPVELKEESACQSHFNDLCGVLGQPTPTDADTAMLPNKELGELLLFRL